MGILDDAIKEHLELKRQHGAAEDELKQLEDEAFGAAERPGGEVSAPDPLAEAPTEFMAQPGLEQPPEPAAGPEDAAPEAEEPAARRSPRAEIADLQEGPPAGPEAPAEEESPAMEHEAVPAPPPAAPAPEPEISSGPTTEEREAIAEQPTEMYDVEAELGGTPAEGAPAEVEGPEPAAEEEYEEDDDFWDEKRLSDELDQALEAPSDEVEDEEALYEDAATEAEEPEPERPEPEASSGEGEEDVLEETPDFLEEAPEDDQLWFEQKPPKDFDFDD
jgi:hypothetical protein